MESLASSQRSLSDERVALSSLMRLGYRELDSKPEESLVLLDLVESLTLSDLVSLVARRVYDQSLTQGSLVDRRDHDLSLTLSCLVARGVSDPT